MRGVLSENPDATTAGYWLGLAVFQITAATSATDERQTLKGLCLRAVSEMGRPFLLPICQLSITSTAAKRG
jgi:hypothetical protein